MTTALVGHTGFVGSNLLRQARFDACFHSTDIQRIEGRSFDLVVCAGAPAAKWKANQEPEADRANLERLMGHLSAVRAGRLVLVSTVDVYPDPSGADEATPIDPSRAQPYGRHRRALEDFCRTRFAATVLRLPGLFGPGLKKNVVYDLLHDNCLDQIQPRSSFQLYDLEDLWADVERVLGAGVDLVNLAVEPVTVAEVGRAAFGRAIPEAAALPVVRYDFRTRHAALWGRAGPYLQTKGEVLERLSRFVAGERARGTA